MAEVLSAAPSIHIDAAPAISPPAGISSSYLESARSFSTIDFSGGSYHPSEAASIVSSPVHSVEPLSIPKVGDATDFSGGFQNSEENPFTLPAAPTPQIINYDFASDPFAKEKPVENEQPDLPGSKEAISVAETFLDASFQSEIEQPQTEMEKPAFELTLPEKEVVADIQYTMDKVIEALGVLGYPDPEKRAEELLQERHQDIGKIEYIPAVTRPDFIQVGFRDLNPIVDGDALVSRISALDSAVDKAWEKKSGKSISGSNIIAQYQEEASHRSEPVRKYGPDGSLGEVTQGIVREIHNINNIVEAKRQVIEKTRAKPPVKYGDGQKVSPEDEQRIYRKIKVPSANEVQEIIVYNFN